MRKPINPSFEEFWSEMRGRLTWFGFGLLWRVPAAVLASGFVVQLWYCLDMWSVQHALACKDLQNPLGMLERFSHSMLPLALFACALIVFLYMIGIEWGAYKQNEPSHFTHRTWRCGSYLWIQKWKQELFRKKRRVGQIQIEAEELDSNHYRVQGGFAEREMLTYVKRWVGWWNKPRRADDQGMSWVLFVRNGDQVHVDLERDVDQPGVWTMRTIFYEWDGRKNPPRRVQTHITEFVPQE